MAGSFKQAFFLAFAATFTASATLAQPVSGHASQCKADSEILAVDRSSVDAIAIGVSQAVFKGDGDAAFRAMSEAAQASTKASDLAQYARIVERSGPYQDIRVAHTYQIDVKGGRDPLPPTICGHSLTDPEAVALSMEAIPRQFHVEIRAHTINNDWTMFVWLIPEKGALKVLSLNLNASAISGRNGPELHKLAVTQAARGHRVNAVLLYQAAEGVSGRGPNATPIWKRDLDKDANGLALPPEFTAGSSGGWRFGGETFHTNDVGVLGVGGSLSLIFVRHPASWSDVKTTDAGNRAFVTGLLKSHPEFSDGFQAIVVRAMKPDGSGGLGTVYEFGKGFGSVPAG